MKKDKKRFKLLIFILAGLVVFQAVSISVLWVKNLRLKQALSKKSKVVVLHKKAFLERRQAQPQQAAIKAAIVLDDWGYSRRNLKELLSIGEPITISVLPNLQYSKSIAEESKKNGVEIILHLPLEAHDSKKTPEKGTIYTYTSQKDVLEILRNDLKSVPFIDGVSNHMGSKATEDEKLMKLIFGELKKKNLYFLDNLVTNKSVCKIAAEQTGIKFAERAVFLDNKMDAEYIKGQIRQLLTIAKARQAAIGTGHDKALTLKAIKDMLPEFQREGVELVYVSDLVN